MAKTMTTTTVTLISDGTLEGSEIVDGSGKRVGTVKGFNYEVTPAGRLAHLTVRADWGITKTDDAAGSEPAEES